MLYDQDSLTNNRSEMLRQYLAQLENLIAATKEGSGLFKDFANELFNLLRENWASTIRHLLIIIGIIVGIPLAFLVIAITIKCISLLYCCYRPLISYLRTGINVAGSGMIRLVRRSSRSLHNSNQSDASVVRYQALPRNEVNIQPKRERLRTKRHHHKRSDIACSSLQLPLTAAI